MKRLKILLVLDLSGRLATDARTAAADAKSVLDQSSFNTVGLADLASDHGQGNAGDEATKNAADKAVVTHRFGSLTDLTGEAAISEKALKREHFYNQKFS